MKLTYYGLVLACLYIAAYALPANLEMSKDAALENTAKLETTKLETPKIENTQVNTEAPAEISIKTKKEPKTEEVKKTENNDKTQQEKPETVIPVIIVNEPKAEVETVAAESQIQIKTVELPGKIKETTNDKKDKDLDDSKNKENNAWHDFDDHFSLLEDRLPELTDEEEQERGEDSIPLNFLKGFDISKQLANENKLLEQLTASAGASSGIIPALKAETPIYITIPVVINSHSTLPISLSIGGQEIPLTVANKDASFAVPSSQLDTMLKYASTPRRPTNRQRNNLRSKIYARNKRHEVFEFKRDV